MLGKGSISIEFQEIEMKEITQYVQIQMENAGFLYRIMRNNMKKKVDWYLNMDISECQVVVFSWLEENCIKTFGLNIMQFNRD